jgi:hypothetical protein
MRLFSKRKNDFYRVDFCVKEADSYNVIESREIKPNQSTINYDEQNTFIIDIENHTYRTQNARVYCIDINGKQIHFKSIDKDQIITSQFNSLILNDEIVKQLAKATITPPERKFDYLALGIGAIIGGLIGFIAKIFIALPI